MLRLKAVRLCSLVLPAAATLLAPSASGGGPCGADLDASGQIDSVDVALLLGQWTDGGPGPCPSLSRADLNGDCRVDGLDIAALLAEWGPAPTFDYGPAMTNEEAAQIALEMLGAGGALAPSAADYQRVERDLALIRVFEPALANAAHGPVWNPTRLHVYLTLDVDQTELQCLIRYFRAEQEVLPLPPCDTGWRKLTFPGRLNLEALEDLFTRDVGFAYICRIFVPGGSCWGNWCFPCITSCTVGGGGLNGWHPVVGVAGVWRWTVRKGHFCVGPQEVWDFETDSAGTVRLLDYQGPEVFAGYGCAH